MINKINEKVNKFFTRDKNGYERTFDYFLRTITFFVILIFVLVYATKVHADESEYDYDNITQVELRDCNFVPLSSLTGYEDIIFSQFTVRSNFASTYGNSVYNPLDNAVYFFQPYDYNWFDRFDLPVPTTWTDVYSGTVYTYNPEEQYLYIRLNSYNAGFFEYQVFYIDKSKIWNNRSVSGYSSDILTVTMKIDTNFNVSAQRSWSGNPGGNIILYTDMPLYVTNGATVSSNDTEPNVTDTFDSSYIANINIPLINGELNPEPEAPEGETAKNNLYFNDVQIGMLSQSGTQDLLSSSFVIGLDVSDYAKNHLDDFSVYVSYHIHMKDSDLSTSDPSTAYTQVLPLKTFLNNAYTCGISEIFNNAPISLGNYTTFMQYYNHITSTHSVRVNNNDGIFNSYGIFPTIMKSIGFNIGQYNVTSYDVSNYTIFDFSIDVGVSLWENPVPSGDTSSPFIKRFDLINGTQSILNADGLVNNNPYEGETGPQVNPYVPSGGTSTASQGGAYANATVGDINVTVNNSNNNGLLPDNNEDDNLSTLEQYKQFISEFNDNWEQLGSFEDQDGGFLGFLRHSFNFIPGLSFLVLCCSIIFGLCVILFVIKVLLF